MNKTGKLIGLVLGIMIGTGCFAQRNETVQKDAIAYLQFTGSVEGAVFSVTAQNATSYNRARISDGMRYALRPAVYRVTVEKGGYPVVQRQIFCVDGETVEIRVP